MRGLEADRDNGRNPSQAQARCGVDGSLRRAASTSTLRRRRLIWEVEDRKREPSMVCASNIRMQATAMPRAAAHTARRRA